MIPVSASDDSECRDGFGPYLPGIEVTFVDICVCVKKFMLVSQLVPFDDAVALERAISDPNTAAVMLEPIQGEAGALRARATGVGAFPMSFFLCRRADSVGRLSDGCARCVHQAQRADDCRRDSNGSRPHRLHAGTRADARSGAHPCVQAVEHEKVRPDIVTVGKALSGGLYPVSGVFADSEVMLTIQPGQHGSTYGGNPLANKVAIAALSALQDEGMCANAIERGEQLRRGESPARPPSVVLNSSQVWPTCRPAWSSRTADAG